MNQPNRPPDLEQAVARRYGAAARQREDALCCPVEYDARFLEAIPLEVLERDYGCGDPSRYVREGDVVLDLGSGGGKICFIACQIVGPGGRVIGVDVNADMLALARSAAPKVAERVGFANVEFRHGHIQDLALDLDQPSAQEPMIADGSVDLVVSNCVLNLVRPEHKTQLIGEIHRVVRNGGRIAISDIVSDAPVPEALQNDPDLWSGCISGAFEERALLSQLAALGFRDVAVDVRESKPFAVVQGIAFHSVTVTAHKGAAGDRCGARSCC